MTKTFLRGLFAILPLILTVSIVLWLLRTIEGAIQPLVIEIVPESWQVPGLGLFVVLLIIYLVGLVLYYPASEWFLDRLEKGMLKVPVFKTVYSAVQDLTHFVKQDRNKSMGQVVLVRIQGGEQRMIGLVTKSDMAGMPKELADAKCVAVFLPLSYAMGGYTTFVPREWIQPVDMKVDDALKSALTAWMGGRNQSPAPSPALKTGNPI